MAVKTGLIWHPPKRDIFDPAPYISEIEDAIGDLADEVKGDFEDIVSDWSTAVTFRKTVRIEAGGISITIGPATNAKIWGFVDRGTRPHIIRPKRAKRLAFNTGYSARTKPGKAHVGSGTASGPVAYAGEVHHPGSEPRNFTKDIAEKYRTEIARVVKQAIRDGKRG